MKDFIIIMVCTVVIPVVVYFSVKFGVVAFYKAKQFIEKEKPCCNESSQAKCDQCQETGSANPHNH